MNSRLKKLPSLSKEYKEFVASQPLEQNQYVPCPRCGSKNVNTPIGKTGGLFTGFATMGCFAIVILVIAIIVGIFFLPLGLLIGIGGMIGVFLLPLMGFSLGSFYRCKSCNFMWNFEDMKG
jgi:hypothetical protein